MQDPKETILTSTDKLLSFKNKIHVQKKHLSSGNTEIFLLLLQIQYQSDYKEVIPLIISHLPSLTDNPDQYIPSLLSEMYDWVRNRFVASSQNSLSMQKEEQL
jgi:hypothetical protein